MSGFKAQVDLSEVMALGGVINKAIFPLMNDAVKAVSAQTAINWQKAVYRAKLWSGEKDAYAQSITWEMTSDFSAVIQTDYKNAVEIEHGRPAKDLKRMLDTSLKVRLSAKGKRYLIIPFTHNTPGNNAHAPAMPKAVYAQAKKMSLSTIIGHSRRESGTGAFSLKTKAPIQVRQRKYNWGDRLVTKGMKNGSRYDGMVRMNTATGEAKGKSSRFLTFRVMVEGSPGWIVPPQPGQNIVRDVVAQMQPLADTVFNEAIRRTKG